MGVNAEQQRKMTIARYIQDFLNAKMKKSKNTHDAYFNDIRALFKQIFGHTNFDSLTKEDIESLTADELLVYFDDLYQLVDENGERVYANSSINRFQASIKSLLKYLVARNAIEYNLTSLKLIEKNNTHSDEGEMIPLDIAMQYVDYVRVFERRGVEKALLIKLALETALRAEELLKLEWKQFVVEEDGVAIISKAANKGKGNKDYVDKIDHAFYNELLELKTIGNTVNLFTLKYRTVADMMYKLNTIFSNQDRNFTFHSFKRTSVTMVYLMTGCIVTAQKKARHNDINTTRSYLKIQDQPITGIISSMMSNDEHLYKKIEHDLLIKCLDKCRLDMKVVLNKIIREEIK